MPIVIRGARVHNLQNIDVTIPRDKLVVLTGLSGSGKSSLAFDTIYAEGQRRYVESLSAYARQFLGLMDKPDVDQIDGLSPAISIDQKSVSHNPRSTVGTVTEIYDYLRLLFARTGHPHCPNCGEEISRQTVAQIVARILKLNTEQVMVMAPVVRDQKGEHKKILKELEKAGYARVRFDGFFYTLSEADALPVDKQKKHSLDVVIDRVALPLAGKPVGSDVATRLREAVEQSLDLGNGLVVVHETTNETDHLMSEHLACAACGIDLPELEPRNFSFNSPHGACPKCTGLGTKQEIDPEFVMPNPRLSIAEGAIRPWSRSAASQYWHMSKLETVAKKRKFSLTVPVGTMKKSDLQYVLYGDTENDFEGVIPFLERRYQDTDSDYFRNEIEGYMRVSICPSCGGKRLKAEVLGVTVGNRSIADVTMLSIDRSIDFFASLDSKETPLNKKEQEIAKQILKEIRARLDFLHNVGLDYLTLDRSATTLSGGEAQRIRLATQIGSSLVGVIYILDEPSIGLHQRDNARLIATLKSLRDLGNTVIVVEHDEDTMRAADELIDIGPGAGKHGGRVVAQGSPSAVAKNEKSLTGQYLSGKRSIAAPKSYRKGNGKELTILGAAEFNLKNIDVTIPLGELVVVSGVSGSGKSTLVTEILSKALAQKFYRAKDNPGKHRAIRGLEHLDKVITIDQSPIGRTPRSNPATYTGLFTPIRDLFAGLPESNIRGYKPGRFSFNVKGGRCEACQGEGQVAIEMQFLADVYVDCDECHGTRYNASALEIHYRGKNIAEVLNMTVEEAKDFFQNIPSIKSKLDTLYDVGLGYIHLGQPATTLSGGEAQRVKLATELSRRATGKTLYILDEPTTGLHFEDVRHLLTVLQRLVDKGNSILVIEHNLDVIKSADWLIDLGPEGGVGGGEVVAAGTPKDVAKVKQSYTGQFLKKLF
ncbi:excinuclease ABC subunit UvrA [Candidatus Uhrbacteria bacterium CG10_big_fil_rev_8_21_14_0_10_48_11]|uniref:UvrABC system protein A n=1 Tax=Candidatus Uhrbacteria bacterium CG10_big_fil_rev_8_21_14_0_10_48_11 TaxID=1975037 RepID=A0A2M8LFR2_9BACT|nr:MAG: excinuclease ABC subunit UvrA [Candidatus Uhrbacteria bacterium CG10_big_fil_rev_8_21_14_0_10_48_11]